MISIRQECIAIIICNDVHMVILRRALFRKNYNTDILKRKPGRGVQLRLCAIVAFPFRETHKILDRI